MQRLVRVFPILPGREPELREFVRELETSPRELSEFYETYGIGASYWYLEELAQQTILVVITEVVAAQPFAASYATSERKFDRWFKDSVRRISGIDPDVDPLGPACELLFRWTEPERDNGR